MSPVIFMNTYVLLQGEMSATVFYFPQSYRTLMPLLRTRVLANKPPAWGANLQIGVSTNFDKLCGCVLQVRGPSVPHYIPVHLPAQL
jgi:hypothetical protein